MLSIRAQCFMFVQRLKFSSVHGPYGRLFIKPNALSNALCVQGCMRLCVCPGLYAIGQNEHQMETLVHALRPEVQKSSVVCSNNTLLTLLKGPGRPGSYNDPYVTLGAEESRCDLALPRLRLRLTKDD